MTCKKCNHQMEENATFCTECGYSPEVENHRNKLTEMKKRAMDNVINHCHSPLFLVFTILLTVVLGASVLGSLLSGGILGFIFTSLPTVFVILVVVGLWKAFSAKDKDSIPSALRLGSIYDGFGNVAFTVFLVLFGILGGFGIILSMFNGGGFDGFLSALLSFSILIALTALGKSIFKKRREYFLSLIVLSESGTYTGQQAPVAESIIMGVINSMIGFCTMFMLPMADFSDLYMSYLPSELGDMTDIFEDALNISLNSPASYLGVLLSSMGCFALCGFYICQAIWMSILQNKIVASKREIHQEEEVILEIEKKTRSAINANRRETEIRLKLQREAEEEAERRRQQEEEEALLRKREEEAAKLAHQREQEAAMQRQMNMQQQMMMQMMMQKMMGTNPQSAQMPQMPTASPGPAEEARLLELQREKEEAEAKAKQAEEQQKMMMQMMQQMMESMNNNSAAKSDSENKT